MPAAAREDEIAPVGGGTLLARLARPALAPAAVLLLHAPLSRIGLDLYDRHEWIDIPMHVLGGVAITLWLDRALAEWERWARRIPRGRDVLLIAGTLAAALAWEGLELLADTLFGTGAQRGTADTLGDIANGLVGGALWIGGRRLAGAR